MMGNSTMFVAYNVLHFNYWAASASNYAVGGICSYFLNKHYTFKNKEQSAAQIVRFVVNLLICYFVSYKLAIWAVKWMLGGLSPTIQENIAMCAGTCLYVATNYVGQRLFVFNKKEENKD